jgi:hypothetical protein
MQDTALHPQPEHQEKGAKSRDEIKDGVVEEHVLDASKVCAKEIS